jgi:hypothetical protein
VTFLLLRSSHQPPVPLFFPPTFTIVVSALSNGAKQESRQRAELSGG